MSAEAVQDRRQRHGAVGRKAVAPIVVVGFLVVLFVLSVLTMLLSTRQQVAEIRALEGKSGSLSNLLRNVRTRPVTITAEPLRTTGLARLQLPAGAIARVLKFPGEGLPYFEGWLAYDEESQRVIKVVVDELW